MTKQVRGRKPPEAARPDSPASPPLAPARPAPAPPKTPPPRPADLYETVRYRIKSEPAVRAPETDLPTPATAPMDPATGWLVVLHGPGRGRSFPLGYGVHSVGRAEDQRIRLNFGDKRISRRQHLSVTYDGKGRTFYVSPGSGSSLAHLNGEPILQTFPLKSSDRILVGETELALVPFCGPDFDWQEL